MHEDEKKDEDQGDPLLNATKIYGKGFLLIR